MHGDTDQAIALPLDGRTPARFQMHGTTIALKLGENHRWVAAMIRGPSGSGKSDLALRCLAQPLGSLLPDSGVPTGVSLIADDRTELSAAGQAPNLTITASSPPSIAGLIEVRGLGIVAVPHIPSAQLVLIVDLVSPRDVSRFPTPATTTIGPIGIIDDRATAQHVAVLPQITLTPFEASSPLKLMLALIQTAMTGSPMVADAAKHHRLPEGQ